MLPAHLLSLVEHDGWSVPRYLTSRDEAWLAAVLDVANGFVGRTVKERDDAFVTRVRAIARRHVVPERIADGVARVIARRARTISAAAQDPLVVRRVVFAHAARAERPDRHAALVAAAAELGATPEALSDGLFADRYTARLITAGAPLSPSEAVLAYNLALVEGLLLRSEKVVAHAREHATAIVRFARWSGLLCTFALDEDGTRLEVSGPLAVLRRTTKYGRALARFFPSVLSHPGLRLRARCLLGNVPTDVRIDASDPIARPPPLPRDGDSPVVRALARDLRATAAGWSLRRDPPPICFEGRVLFPDFALVRGDQSVNVEIVGFHTPEYLRSKLEVLRRAPVPLLVCVDESLACDDGDLPADVIRFHKKLNPAHLLARAEQLRVDRHGCATESVW